MILLFILFYFIILVTLPTVEYTVETGAIKVDPKKRNNFPLKQLPISTTFAIFEE